MKKISKNIESYIIADKLQAKESKLLFFNNIHLMFNKGVTFMEIAEILQRMRKINNKQLKEAGFFIDSVIVNFKKKDIKQFELDRLALYFK
jgi:phage regulator Rha-like protein